MIDETSIRNEICDIGRRLYAKGFAAAADGNISYRLAENVVLCTPTQICKGFMHPDDLCTVDLDGNQLAGKRKRTSEILLHLEIYRGDPAAKSVVHCHPTHATAFGIARIDIPTQVSPEIEVCLGVVPRAEYATPGTQKFAETVCPFLGHANAVILSNHGTATWSDTVEKAFWLTEMLESYCRLLLVAKQLGHVERLPGEMIGELLEQGRQYGFRPEVPASTSDAPCINPDFGRAK